MTIAIQLLSAPNGAVTATIKDIAGATVQGPIALTETPVSSNFFVGTETPLADGQYLVLFNDTDPDLIGVGCIVYEDGEEVEGVGTDALQQFIDAGLLQGSGVGGYAFTSNALSQIPRPARENAFSRKEAVDIQEGIKQLLIKDSETSKDDSITNDINRLQTGLEKVQEAIKQLTQQGKVDPKELERLSKIPDKLIQVINDSLGNLSTKVGVGELKSDLKVLSGKLDSIEGQERVSKEDIKDAVDKVIVKKNLIGDTSRRSRLGDILTSVVDS